MTIMDLIGEFVALKLAPSSPSYRRIAEHVRALIVSGKCPPDSRLPSTQELAAIWQTTPQTVQKGFRLLANQHLVVRIPKKGTFVASQKPRLATIGMYCTSFSLGDRSPFTREVLAGLETVARQEKIELAAFLDPRMTYVETGEPWSPLVKAVDERRIQAVTALTANHHSLRWLTRLKVPVAVHGTALLPNMVWFDRKQFLDLALEALRDQGCSTLGLITAEYPRPSPNFSHQV